MQAPNDIITTETPATNNPLPVKVDYPRNVRRAMERFRLDKSKKNARKMIELFKAHGIIKP